MPKENEEYLRILKTEFQQRKLKNKRYSLRAFSKFLGLNHATLSQVMSASDGLKTDQKRQFGSHMGHWLKS